MYVCIALPYNNIHILWCPFTTGYNFLLWSKMGGGPFGIFCSLEILDIEIHSRGLKDPIVDSCWSILTPSSKSLLQRYASSDITGAIAFLVRLCCIPQLCFFLQELPEQWNNVKKQAVLMKQAVAPLQATEVGIIRRKLATFDVSPLKEQNYCTSCMQYIYKSRVIILLSNVMWLLKVYL